MVVFHGCTLPRGRVRIFPNDASSETVQAGERLWFALEHCYTKTFHACILPFVRNTMVPIANQLKIDEK